MFSIIIPFFDEIHLISRAVKSCQQETVAPIEILIVNDNPAHVNEDDFAELGLGDYVRVLHHDVNKGLQAARNTGILEAKGEYLLFLDSDDYFLEGTLDGLLAYTLKHQADITHFNTYTGFASSRRLKTFGWDKRVFSEEQVFTGDDIALKGTFSLSTWSSVYRKSFLLTHDLLGDEEQRTFEDRLYVLQTMLAAKTLAVYPKSIRVWCRRANSITTTVKSSATFALKTKAFQKQIDVIARATYSDRVKAELLAQEIALVFSQIATGGTDEVYQQMYLSYDSPEMVDVRAKFTRILLSAAEALDPGAIHAAVLCRLSTRRRRKDRRLSRQHFDRLWRAIKAADSATVRSVLAEAYPRMDIEALIEQDRPQSLAPSLGSAQGEIDYFVHVGTHKTGTTFMQGILSANRDLLRENGVLFPATGYGGASGFQSVKQGGVPGHDSLRNGLIARDRSVIHSLDKEIAGSNCSKVLISSENLCSKLYDADKAPGLKNLAAILAQLPRLRSCTFVVYFRDPVDWLDSYYRECLAAGFDRAFSVSGADEFASNHYRAADYSALVAGLKDLSGNKVVVRDFEAAKKTGLVADLLTSTFPELDHGLADAMETEAAETYPNICNAQVEVLHNIRSLVPRAQIYKEVARRFLARTTPTANRSVLFNHVICEKIRSEFKNPARNGFDNHELDELQKKLESKVFRRVARTTAIPEAYGVELANCLSPHAVFDKKLALTSDLRRFMEVSHVFAKPTLLHGSSSLLRFLYRL